MNTFAIRILLLSFSMSTAVVACDTKRSNTKLEMEAEQATKGDTLDSTGDALDPTEGKGEGTTGNRYGDPEVKD